MKVKHIIGIDPASLKTGLAIMQVVPTISIITTKTIGLPDNVEHHLGRWSLARNLILDFLQGTAVSTAIIEYPPFIMNHSIVTLSSLISYMTIAAEACYAYGIRDIILKEPKKVRKDLGLPGTIKKPELLPIIQGWFPELKELSLKKDADQIDAVGIAYSYVTAGKK